MDFQAELRSCQDQIEQALAGYFTEDVPQKKLYEAMRYSLLAGGKRIRPVLTLKFCQVAGGRLQDAMPVACGVEMLHTYSLIHDDLPCMDNDDLRRGRPTNHKVFGECTATLAGDALQCAAFQAVLSAPLDGARRAACALELAQAAGADGMCGGQQLDMDGEVTAFDARQVMHMNALKTGRLLRCACAMGVLAAGGGGEQVQAARDYADAIGLAFQIRDDMLNVTSSPEAMGKPVGNDEVSQKSTFVSLYGLDECDRMVRFQTEKAREKLRGVFDDTAFLDALAEYLAERQS